MRTLRRWLIPLLAAAVLGGCTLTPRRPGTEQQTESRQTELPALPAPAANVNSIPDAVPHAEPRSKYGNPASYDVFGQRYSVLPTADGYFERGTASWYGPGFHGVRTSSGESYDMYGMTAAHKTLPIPAYARVTNLNNGRSVVVRINDRGPFVGDRLIDLSWSAAAKLDMLRNGTAPVEVRVLSSSERDAPAATAATPPPPSVAPTVAAPAVAAPAGGSYLQAASFANPINARKLVERLAEGGIRNSEIRAADADGRRVWRVRVGPIEDRLELDDYVERLSLLGIPDARLAHD